METIQQKTKTYKPILSEYQTEKAITAVKSHFSSLLSSRLNLLKVEAPLVVTKGTGINDDLNGIERPVKVSVQDMPGIEVEIVHSLAKWKRLKLARLEILSGEGLYTDMKALRPDEELSDVHSIFVDQWDWEKVILESDRSLIYLKKIVEDIYSAIVETERYISAAYSELKPFLPEDISFIHSEDLQSLYPGLSPKERETAITKQAGAVFIIGIGAELTDGKKHDGRAPDYDDWITETSKGKRGLNGDIIVWNPILKRAFEISSMGVRVSPESLLKQLRISDKEERAKMEWHKKLLKGELPYTIGGGIGQSRLAMLLLQKKHIAEVQSSIWPEELSKELKEDNIVIL
jgi:aspartate--ammonia ligase